MSLAVFNLQGQKVATLRDGALEAGYHAVQWMGKDDAGRPVSSGVYFVELEAGSFRSTQKMTLLR